MADKTTSVDCRISIVAPTCCGSVMVDRLPFKETYCTVTDAGVGVGVYAGVGVGVNVGVGVKTGVGVGVGADIGIMPKE